MRVKPRTKGVVGKVDYVPYISEALEKLIDAGGNLPEVKKLTGPTQRLQITAHLHIADALQGYWERHRKEYVHRSKSDYKALYVGVITLLKDEELREEKNNQEEISKLEALIREKEKKHKINREISLIRSETRILLQEREDEIISDEQFYEQLEEMVMVYPEGEHRIRIGKLLDKIIAQEQTKINNLNRQNKHRKMERIAKGIDVVDGKYQGC